MLHALEADIDCEESPTLAAFELLNVAALLCLTPTSSGWMSRKRGSLRLDLFNLPDLGLLCFDLFSDSKRKANSHYVLALYSAIGESGQEQFQPPSVEKTSYLTSLD